MSDAIVVLCTAPNETVAKTLASGLVGERLAACVQVLGPVRSVYRWQGTVHDEAEVQLLIKTGSAQFEGVRDWLLREHPYDVPEILALPVLAGSEAYIAWMSEQTG